MAQLRSVFDERRPYPGQDPWIVSVGGDLLLVQSTAGERAITVRRFADLDHMDRNDETVIWIPPPGSDHGREIWAPELHAIDGRWYVYYAASDGRNRNHRTWVLGADDPLGPYRELARVYDPHHDTWAIDLTVFDHNGEFYAVWSGWEGPDDGFPQNLYLAPMADPWTIGGDRTLISRPEHGWEMTAAPINEAPEVLWNGEQGRLFIVYSADASWTPGYKMGLLEWIGGPLRDPTSWTKLSRPIFTGGGHGSFVELDDGLHCVYHRKLSADSGWADREITSGPVSWDDDGYPAIGRRAARAAHPCMGVDGDLPSPTLAPHVTADRAAHRVGGATTLGPA